MYKAIVIGTSHGGLEALKVILPGFKASFSLPVIVVLHIGDHNNDPFIQYLNQLCNLPVKEAEVNETIKAGTIYFAPPNYHLLIDDTCSFSLSTEEKVHFSRPSIDVLFESAAWVYTKSLIGVLLTGANSDGANGLLTIKKLGGTTIIQNPCSAIASAMPRSALKLAKPDFKLSLNDIAIKLNELVY